MVHIGILKFQPSGKDERNDPAIRQIPPEEMAERKKVAEMRAHIEAEAAKMQAALPAAAPQAQPVEPDRGFVLVPVEHDPFAGDGSA